MALGTLSSKSFNGVNDASTFAESSLLHQSKLSFHNDLKTNIVPTVTHKNKNSQDTSYCSETVSWYGPHSETSYFSKTNNSDGSSSLGHDILSPETLHLQHPPLNYNHSSSSFASAANAIFYASSTRSENLVDKITAPHPHIVSSTVDGKFHMDTTADEESLHCYTSNQVHKNYTTTVLETTSSAISTLPTDNFLSGSGPTFNSYGFSNDAASKDWKKPFLHSSGLHRAFADKIDEITYECAAHQYPTLNQHFYDIDGQNSYAFQEFSNAYLSKDDDDDDLVLNSQTHEPVTAGEQQDAGNILSPAFSSNTLTKQYRSFCSELNSPNLPLPDDTDLDFEFPLQLALGAADFDSFLSSVQCASSANVNKFSNKIASINAETVNHHVGFGEIDSCNNKYRRDSLSNLETADLKTAVPNSESRNNKLISCENEQQCMNIDKGIPLSQSISLLHGDTISNSGMLLLEGEKRQHEWLSCHPNFENAITSKNYDLPSQDNSSTHRDLSSHHDVTKYHDSTSAAFGNQKYLENAGNCKTTSHDLKTHTHLKSNYNVTTHKVALDQNVTTHKVAFDHDVTTHKTLCEPEEATHYSLPTSVFGGHEWSHTSSCNFLNVGNFLNVAKEMQDDNFEHADVKKCRNTHLLTHQIITGDAQQYSEISETREASFPRDSYSCFRRNECTGSSSGQEQSVTHSHRQWLSSDTTVGPEGVCYASVEKSYCSQVQGQEPHKFVHPPKELVFAGFSEQNFTDSPLTTQAITSSTAKTTTETVQYNLDRDNFHDSIVEGTVQCKLLQKDAREFSVNESGQRALAAVVTQSSLGAECLDSNLVKSAIDHIIMNRPHSISNALASEIINSSHRHRKGKQSLSGHISEATVQHPEDNSCEREGRRKKRKVSKPPSEDVTTTTRTPSPSAPSSSSSPSMSLVSKESITVSSLVAGVSLSTSSTNENNNSSNVSSSSKPDKRRPSVLPPCRVCSSKASGLHYGVVTCEACNGFFRRSLKRGAIYMCSKEKKCDVNGKKRGECSHCRYKKCITVGMSKSAVKTGRYSDKTRLAYAIETEAQNKTKLLLNDFPEIKGRSTQMLHIHEMDVGESSLFEFNLLEKQFKHLRQSSPHLSSAENAAKVSPLYECNLPEMPTTTFPEYLSKLGLSTMRSIILEQWLGQYLSFAKNVPGFNILSLNDQTNLVRAAWLEVWLLEAYKEFSSDTKGTMTSSGIHQEIETVFGWKWLDLCYRLSTRLERLSISEDELTLVQMLCLSDPLRYGLNAPDQVSSLQWLMSECLLRELEKNHPDEPHAFSEIHSLLTDLKAACHDSQSPSNDYQLQYSSTEETPLLQEILMSSTQ